MKGVVMSEGIVTPPKSLEMVPLGRIHEAYTYPSPASKGKGTVTLDSRGIGHQGSLLNTLCTSNSIRSKPVFDSVYPVPIQCKDSPLEEVDNNRGGNRRLTTESEKWSSDESPFVTVHVMKQGQPPAITSAANSPDQYNLSIEARMANRQSRYKTLSSHNTRNMAITTLTNLHKGVANNLVKQNKPSEVVPPGEYTREPRPSAINSLESRILTFNQPIQEHNLDANLLQKYIEIQQEINEYKQDNNNNNDNTNHNNNRHMDNEGRDEDSFVFNGCHQDMGEDVNRDNNTAGEYGHRGDNRHGSDIDVKIRPISKISTMGYASGISRIENKGCRGSKALSLTSPLPSVLFDPKDSSCIYRSSRWGREQLPTILITRAEEIAEDEVN